MRKVRRSAPAALAERPNQYRVWLSETVRQPKEWVPLIADSLEQAEKAAAKRWKGRVLSVKPIVRPSHER